MALQVHFHASMQHTSALELHQNHFKVICVLKQKKFHQFLLLSAVFYKQACTHININRCSHRIQPPQSMFPVVSLIVRSETKAGYSVSHGTIIVL